MTSKPIIPPVGREPLRARSDRQLQLIRAIKASDQVFTLGPAGTGKTFVPTAMAADMLLSKKISQIILSRPAVEAGEKLGFLPGKLEQKIAPWVIPFIDVLEQRLGKVNVAQLMKDGVIRVEDFAHMRGRTFNDAVILLDEAQNTTVAQMKMFLTRVGENTKIVVNGDVSQKDIPSASGLAHALHLAKVHTLPVEIVEFRHEDIVRSGITRMWAIAFDVEHSRSGRTA